MLVLAAALGLTGFGDGVDASGSAPAANQGDPDTTPTPRPQRPQINPVTTGDNVVVPEAATADDVSGLPTSGVGVTGPAASLRWWTNLAVLLLAANAVVLSALAVRSWRRQVV